MALSFLPGMAAISTVLLALLNSGDHAVVQDEIYGGSHAFSAKETTRCDPAATSHQKVSAEVRKRLGISDNLLRLSVGIENKDDLIEDLRQALGTE